MVNFKLSCKTNATFCIYFATFCDAITGFHVKWRLRNKRRKSILITCHYPDLAVLLMIGRTTRGKFASTSQKHYPDLGSDFSSVWNFCTFFSDLSGGIVKCCLFYQAKYLLVYKSNGRESSEVVHMHSLAFTFAFWIVGVPAFNVSCTQINLQS